MRGRMPRPAAILAAALLALGAAACGGDGGAAHDDSGGGSAQFRVPGADNSIQDFGSEAGQAEFEQGAAVLHAYLDARAGGEWAEACDRLDRKTREMLEKFAAGDEVSEGADCAAGLERMTYPDAREILRKEAAAADVGSLRVAGNRGFALYRGLEGAVYSMSMAREGGEWKVAALSPMPMT